MESIIEEEKNLRLLRKDFLKPLVNMLVYYLKSKDHSQEEKL